MHRVLKPGGYAIVDAPFVQAFCPNTPDLYRFTKYGLEHLFSDGFEVIENRVSIPGGSALAHYAQSMVLFGVEPRWLRGVLAMAVSIALYPLALLKICRRHEVAGAMVLVARKSE